MTNAAFRAALTLCLTLPVLAAPAARAQGDANLHREVALWLAALAFSARAGKAACATARLTADNTASSDAVMILGCMPAPNKVRRERVVISM